MGSGHILCILFDTLVRIYEDYGFTAREAVVKIVEYNNDSAAATTADMDDYQTD